MAEDYKFVEYDDELRGKFRLEYQRGSENFDEIRSMQFDLEMIIGKIRERLKELSPKKLKNPSETDWILNFSVLIKYDEKRVYIGKETYEPKSDFDTWA
jgi:hypothetical protein